MKHSNSRYKIEVEGIVQGVGFRPFVYRLATELALTGWVTNTSDGVLIEVEGSEEGLESFLSRVRAEAPTLSSIVDVSSDKLPFIGYPDFSIRSSLARADRSVLVSPDTALCADCRAELMDPADRRFHHPFINCTNCGPRYTIINSVPYDRPNTSMSRFVMCDQCLSEYDDPADRRFHAQPNACNECGPNLSLLKEDGTAMDGNPLIGAVRMLEDGKIVAIKGLGGFHLAVDPFDDAAVKRLRARKGREEKPFAVMVKGLAEAGKLCEIDSYRVDLLTCTESPIVLLDRRKDPELHLSPSVAPKSRYYGLMLPYTPLHVLLMENFQALVMTSANLTEEPLCADIDEAKTRLAGIADAYLTHDRRIVLRCDDSIVRPADEEPERGPIVLRRARGFVPAPVFLPSNGRPVLALGPELKGTVCLTRGNKAFLGQHLGDLTNLETLEFLGEVVVHLKDILDVEPEAVACDLHPDYLTTGLALAGERDLWARDIPVYRVQHHHAHILSTQADNGMEGPVVGLALDGTGYGSDGTIWGGEILHVDGTRMERLGHLVPVWMPGGERAIREPYRMALSYMMEARGEGAVRKLAPEIFPTISSGDLDVLIGITANKTHGIKTSSCGRLFDAFSAILGICHHTRYEGQAAIELEMLTDASVGDTLPFSVERDIKGTVQVNMVPAFDEALELHLSGEQVGRIGGMFHLTLARALAEAVFHAVESAEDSDPFSPRIPLGGGVFQNETFLKMISKELRARSLEPVTHRNVPTNDGGISLGQAVYARQALEMEANL
ncbi:carbamoyltransferase HypF [bacterium]|nr:MAG: carbamoyltransferase HypF [bacterium]